jgi:hypothetical protein
MILERLARAGLDQWAAELAALHGRPWKMLTFAGSLVISPAVDEPSWGERAIGVGRAASTAAGVTLLGAALFNVFNSLALVVVAAAVMAVVGMRVRLPGVTLIGLALFAFLLAGNEVAVMPFMGVRDILPAVVTWTLGTALVLRVSRGRLLLAAVGTLITLDLATIAGSWHAADVLGRGLGSSPTWFPLALWPGGGADLLIANASAMTGPMLLCSVFILASALRRPTVDLARTPARTVAGVAAALGSLAFCEWMSRTPHDLAEAFGFGFAAHPVGSATVALLIALLIVRAVGKVADPM